MEPKTELPSLPYLFAKNQGVVIVSEGSNTFLCHLPDTSWASLAEVSRLLQRDLPLKEVNESEFQYYLTLVYQSTSSMLDLTQGMNRDFDLKAFTDSLPTAQDLLDIQDDAPIIRLINGLFSQAIQQKASDIHIETYESRILVRNRIDGVLQEVLEIQRGIAPLVISRIKIMAKLDISEKRIPQDGRISVQIGGHAIDVRVSTLPSNHGERIVLRILDKKTAQLDLNLLGMQPSAKQKILEMIEQPHGILLVTGPTGSGKTTSLYAMLNELNEVSRNILTIEDPIEYDLPGVGQTQVNTKVNMTFAKGLRAILRQDPDVVMIGEIRDLETADIAIQASLTGHLVLSTLHTNNALGALNRLHDMGVESFLLSSSIIGLIAQRLVRKLCPNCKKIHQPTPLERSWLTIKPQDAIPTLYEPNGCELCHHSGYQGRTGIYEIITIDETLRGMIHRNENQQTMEQYLKATTPTIHEDGLKRVFAGETSLAEVLRVTKMNSGSSCK